MNSMKLGLIVGLTVGLLSGCAPTLQIERDDVEPDASSKAAERPGEFLGSGIVPPIHDGQAGSPHVRVDWTVEDANISITYGRPFLRNRVVGDTVEPLEGAVWRLGADEATLFTTTRDLMLGKTHVPAGEYTLWTLLTDGTTQLIINKESGQWGTAYDEVRDLGRTDMTVSNLDTPADQLTLSVDNSELRFEWGTMVASVPILVQ